MKIPQLFSLDFANLRTPPIVPQVNVPAVPALPIQAARAFSNIKPITTLAVPKLTPQLFELSPPNKPSGPVPSLIPMDLFPRPSRALELAKQDDIAAGQSDAMPPTVPSPSESGPRLDLEEIMARLRKKKRLIRRAENGFVLPADVVEDMGLDPSLLSAPAAQDLLRAEHFRQVDDIGRIVEHFAAKPGDLYAVPSGRRAHQDVPREIREEVDRWLMEPTIQSALRKLSRLDDVDAASLEYQRRIDLLHKLIYPRAKVRVQPLDDMRTAPRDAAISPADSDNDVAMNDDREPSAYKTSPGSAGWPEPGKGHSATGDS